MNLYQPMFVSLNIYFLHFQTAAKNAASAATQLINCANGATPYNTNKAAHSTLMHKSKVNEIHDEKS